MSTPSAPASRPFAAGDLAGFAAMFHPDATWNHRNDDRLGGVNAGVDGIVAFLERVGAAHRGHAARRARDLHGRRRRAASPCSTRVSATRPDGRTFDDTQILLFTLEDGRVRSVDQFVGDPAAVTAFWA